MQHIVSISGGKDSAACYMLAMLRGMPFRAVTADTGHEHPATYEWIEKLSERTGGPKVEVVRADFSQQIQRKRDLVQTKWVTEGVADEIIAAALDVLHPTGNPFLDLCIWKGRFPSRMAQFCTEWLKAIPIETQLFAPIRETEPVVSWQGERRSESPNRARLPRFQRVKTSGQYDRMIFRPILHWTAGNTFALHKQFGLTPNPLYRQGMGRVGCFPCINSAKAELAAMFARWPDVLEMLRIYEALVSKASKRGQATFFPASTTPQGTQLVADQKSGIRLEEKLPNIDAIEQWSRTTRGGRQLDGLFVMQDAAASCSSQYGLCE